jgi:hypothetical protein
VSSQHTNNVKNFGKFTKPSVPSKVWQWKLQTLNVMQTIT